MVRWIKLGFSRARERDLYNQRMKLALIRQRYTPYGGAERFVERAIEALAGEVSITVFAREWAGQPGVRVARCDPFFIGRVWRDWSFSRAVCGALGKSAFDIVQSHERVSCCDVYRAGDGVHADWLDRRARARPWPVRLLDRLNPYHRYVLRAERRLFASPRLRAVICNSRMVRDDIQRRFGVPSDRLHVIHNGVDLEHFHPSLREAHRRDLRDRLRVGDDELVFLFVGSGFERKGLGTLIRAFSRYPEPRSRLLVVGRDRAEGRMRALASRAGVADRVIFAGPQEDVRPWYGAADVFVLPTLYDPFPNAALEALASGLPVITSGASGAAEVIHQGENGSVCADPLSVGELLDCMKRVGERAESMRVSARMSAEEFGIGVVATRLAGLYRSLALSTEAG